jgi:hypothetical protein
LFKIDIKNLSEEYRKILISALMQNHNSKKTFLNSNYEKQMFFKNKLKVTYRDIKHSIELNSVSSLSSAKKDVIEEKNNKIHKAVEEMRNFNKIKKHKKVSNDSSLAYKHNYCGTTNLKNEGVDSQQTSMIEPNINKDINSISTTSSNNMKFMTTYGNSFLKPLSKHADLTRKFMSISPEKIQLNEIKNTNISHSNKVLPYSHRPNSQSADFNNFKNVSLSNSQIPKIPNFNCSIMNGANFNSFINSIDSTIQVPHSNRNHHEITQQSVEGGGKKSQFGQYNGFNTERRSKLFENEIKKGCRLSTHDEINNMNNGENKYNALKQNPKMAKSLSVWKKSQVNKSKFRYNSGHFNLPLYTLKLDK